ncbi:MAG: Ig-like domain-containing protein [Candidatus Marinimicrobia bacterium]|nr:Ig-like domain-containing protein [Candidatus Neomarinimicrobiota bacterium]
MRSTTLSIFLLFVCAFLCIQCASEGAPAGGPPDKTPPSLISASLQSGAIMVPPYQKLEFIFSENLNPEIVKKSVSIFPIIDDLAKITTRGKYITISPVTFWDSSVVYTIILDKIISDYKGNSLERPLQFSFTSGNFMPENKISGKVSGLKSGSTAVICISRKTSNPDSVIFAPEYYTQSGPEGEFVFDYLPSDMFYIAGYVDIDKSNNYKAKFDGACVPSKPAVLADTNNVRLVVEALYDNFLPGRLLRAESLQPTVSKLTFQKNIAKWNNINHFRVNSMGVDTVLFDKSTCTLYHHNINNDSLFLELNDLFDHLDVAINDTSLNIPVSPWSDSLFHFESIGDYLFVSPSPAAEYLKGIFQSKPDTSELILYKTIPGFYKLPYAKTRRQGTWLIQIPHSNEVKWVDTDSLYSVPMELKPEPDCGAVIGSFKIKAPGNLRLQLYNGNYSYDIPVEGMNINFNKVLPGTYTLSYYIDKNANGRRDVGRPFPYKQPEILYGLDKGIDVRARWDTDLSEPYEIVIENE